MIDDAQGDCGVVRFRLWLGQLQLIWVFASERQVVVLKARQLGISWLAIGYALWECLYRPGRVWLFFSQGQEEADEMTRRARVMYDMLPSELREFLPAYGREPNKSTVEWTNGSRLRSLPSTEKAGRSFTASGIVADEFAFQQWADKLYVAIKPVIDGGGKLFVISTANGAGNLFKRLWDRAYSGSSRFKSVFLPWWTRPGRDQAWYNDKVADADDPMTVRQEYPANPTEAFLATGNVRFNPEWIDAQAENLSEPLDWNSLPKELREVSADAREFAVYKTPVIGRRCIIGCDVAEGLEHGDFSVATIVDHDTLEELAIYAGKPEPDEFGRIIHKIWSVYGGDVVVERNNHGHATIASLVAAGCPEVACGEDGRLGWVTNIRTKPQSIDQLAQHLRDRAFLVRSTQTLVEMKEYQKQPNGKTGAQPGKHDDRVMSWAIILGWKYLRGNASSWGPNPFTSRMGSYR